MTDLFRLTARQAVDLLAKGEVSPLELVEASAARIAATDGDLNAMPTLCLDRARDHAKAIMADKVPAYTGPGALHGLPMSVKELNDVKGVRTTYGSRIYENHVPERSDLMVERLEARGAITMGKSNVPEFGAGGASFNDVFGPAANPWNMGHTPGGSSGGSAASLAVGQTSISTGSDLGGSLRIPASFCGIVGFRPSPGVAAHGPSPAPFADQPVVGPMARNVPDTALMLDAMTGLHGEDPLSRAAPPVSYLDQVLIALGEGAAPKRIGYSPDLGITPVDAEVDAICRAATERLAELGSEITGATIDFSDAPETFHTFRALGFAAGHEDELKRHRDKFKPENIWNIEKGLALTRDDITRAMRARGALFHRMAAFFRDHDVLALPATIVPALPIDMRYLPELNGHRFDNYVDWIMITSVITLTLCPAASIPCGFTKSGLPVGLQLVGRPHGDGELLGWAAVAERLFGLTDLLPIDPRGVRGNAPGPDDGRHVA
jgi:amidase